MIQVYDGDGIGRQDNPNPHQTATVFVESCGLMPITDPSTNRYLHNSLMLVFKNQDIARQAWNELKPLAEQRTAFVITIHDSNALMTIPVSVLKHIELRHMTVTMNLWFGP